MILSRQGQPCARMRLPVNGEKFVLTSRLMICRSSWLLGAEAGHRPVVWVETPRKAERESANSTPITIGGSSGMTNLGELRKRLYQGGELTLEKLLGAVAVLQSDVAALIEARGLSRSEGDQFQVILVIVQPFLMIQGCVP